MKSLLLFTTMVLLVSCGTSHYCYIVRHAEKKDNTPLSLLSATGHERAALLRDSLMSKKIAKIFATTLVRTQETAQPLATAINQPVVIYRHDAIDSIAAVIKQLSNKNILVVGHSGTIPRIIESLTGDKVTRNLEAEYDNLFIIETRKSSRRLKQVKYGGASR
jgi:broad specificity phosphatase PhoE